MSDPDDPKRWSEGEPSTLGDLFAAARRDIPDEHELSKLASRLEPTLSSARGPHPMRWAKLAAFTAVGAAVVAGGSLLLRTSSAPLEAPKRLETPAPTASTPELPPVATSASPQPNPTSSVPSAEHKALAVESEASLLERARRELSRNPAQALALANEHARRFPRGMLGQEREVIAIAALRQLGRAPEADRRAARFDSTYPHSAHQRTIDGSTR